MASTSVHMDSTTLVSSYGEGTYGWLMLDSVTIHLFNVEQCDRLIHELRHIRDGFAAAERLAEPLTKLPSWSS